MSDPGERTPSRGAALSIPLEICAILSQAWRDASVRWARWTALWATVLVASVVIYPYDRVILRTVQPWGAPAHEFAAVISTIGRFENSSLLFSVVLAALGLILRRPHWRQAAVACLLAGAVAGLAVTIVRPSLGRARPHAEGEPGFHFFQIDADYHSMPSGHASTNMASAMAVARVLPPLAVPSLAYAGAVAWSRMQLNRHHPSDILWGITLGGTLGWTIAGAIVGRRRADPSTSSAPS